MTDETLQHALSALSRLDWHDRVTAAKTLRQYPVPLVIDALLAVANDPDLWVAIAVVETLGQFGTAASTAVPRLCEILTQAAAQESIDPDEADYLSAVVTTLGHIRHLNAAPTLLSLYHQTPPSSAQAAIRRTLPLFDTPLVHTWLAEELARLHAQAIDPAIDVRDRALALLDDLCQRESLPIFLVALHDPSYFVRERAIKAIGALVLRYPHAVTPALVQALSECLADAAAWYAGGPRICDSAAAVLKQIGSSEAHTILGLWQARPAT